MRRNRRERGSIVVFMAMCLLLLGVLFGAIVPLATSMRARTTRRTDELRARLSFEGGVATFRSKSLAMTLVVAQGTIVMTNGIVGTVSTATNASPAGTLLVTGTMNRNDQVYRFSRVIGARKPHPYAFALCSNSNLTLKKANMGSFSQNGDVFSNGNVTLQSGGGQINGNLMAVTTLSAGSNTITGRSLTSQTAIPWPSITTLDYLTEATAQSLVGNASIALLSNTDNGVTFSSPQNGKYFLEYNTLNLTLSGTISGKGTIYVDGNLTISGNVTYANAASEVAIIVRGNVTVNNSVSSINGYIFCGGTFSHGNDLTISRGAVVTNAYSASKDLSIVRDNAIRDDNDEGGRLRLPYFWP